MDIMSKLKDVLSETELKKFEKATQKLITEEVALRVEEKTTELESKADSFVAKKIEEGIESEKEVILEEYDKKMEIFEDEMVERLDKFLDLEISTQIKDETLKKIAVNEALAPLVDGIKGLFEEKYVSLDTEGSKLVEEKELEVQDLRSQLSEKIAENMELAEDGEKAACDLLIERKTSHLTQTDKDRVANFCEGKTFDDMKGKIDSFVSLVEDDSNTEDDVNEGENLDDKDFIKENEETEESSEKETITEDNTEESEDDVSAEQALNKSAGMFL